MLLVTSSETAEVISVNHSFDFWTLSILGPNVWHAVQAGDKAASEQEALCTMHYGSFCMMMSKKNEALFPSKSVRPDRIASLWTMKYVYA